MEDVEMGTLDSPSAQLILKEANQDFAEEKVRTSFGLVSVYVVGDRKKPAILTFHDLGLNANSCFQSFFQFSEMTIIADKFCVYHVNAPGQEEDAVTYPENIPYPTLDDMAHMLETITEHFNIKSLVGFGVGAGANILCRYALKNPKIVDALILVNCTVQAAGWVEWGYQKANSYYLRNRGMTNLTVDYLMWHNFGRNLDECSPDLLQSYKQYFSKLPNPKNLAHFIDSYVKRTELNIRREGPTLQTPVLLIVGIGSAFINESVDMNGKLDPTRSNWMKISDTSGLVLEEKPDKVTEAVLLFLQGQGHRNPVFEPREMASIAFWFDLLVAFQFSLQPGNDCIDPGQGASLRSTWHEIGGDGYGNAAVPFEMDALNFLFQKPALNWLDFYLEPDKLIPHLDQTRPEPNEDQLISQFCEQAKLEEQLQCLVDLPPDEVDYHAKKAKKLWCLALSVCAHLKWNLASLRRKCHVVHAKRLVQELCRIVIGAVDLGSILRGETADWTIPGTGAPAALVASTKLICARWILDVVRNDAFPTPPPKITVSNPSAQIDPSLPLLEAKRVVIQELQSLTESAVQFLINATSTVESIGEQYCIVSPSCFVIPSEGDQQMNWVTCNWNEVEMVPARLAYLQCVYDIGEQYFFQRNYKMAKECMKTVSSGYTEVSTGINSHFTMNSQSIIGYCRALKIDIPGATAVELSAPQSGVSKYVQETEHVKQRSYARYAQLHSANLLSSLKDLVAITDADVQFLRRPENASTFCLALKEEIPNHNRSPYMRKIIKAYLRFLCSCHPPLLDTLKGCGVFDRLHESSLRRYTAPAVKGKDASVDLTLLSKLDSLWQILHTFDSGELKSAAHRTQPNRVSSHFFVPVSVQPLLLKLPAGIYQDLVALSACKAQQLTMIGATVAVPALLDLASHEARSGLGETAPELAWEPVRLDLVRWHNLLHRCSDVQRMGQMTMELATKVKSYIAACSHKSAPAISHWELPMLASSFLLNTCDWEFIILHCPSFHRFANFAKVLAGLCYEVNKGSANVRNVAREFFDIMLPTMMDSVQYKRGTGGGQTSMVRESPVLLLSRSYFTAIVTYLKEPCAVSLLLSFFVKLYNGLKGGIVEIFAEHLNLWPNTFVDSTGVNESYLKEIFLLTLENALLVNPNNPVWLRARGDFEFANDRLSAALQYYLQSLLSCSDAFSKPLPSHVVDDRLILNMVKCCGRLDCHTLEALLCQLLSEPNYGLAMKALQEPINHDSADSYYRMVWDPALLELLVHVLDKSNQHQARLELAIRVYSQYDNNIHNDERIMNEVVSRRKRTFLMAMSRLFL